MGSIWVNEKSAKPLKENALFWNSSGKPTFAST
jgi:hypothetical protein